MDGTGERTCDPDKDRVAELTVAIINHGRRMKDLLEHSGSSCAPWLRIELQNHLRRLTTLVRLEIAGNFCEYCPADEGGCSVRGRNE